jgi:hypothetical protein
MIYKFELCKKKMLNIKLLLRRRIQIYCKSHNTVYKTIIILLCSAMLYNILSEYSFLSTIILGISIFLSAYLLKITNVKL